MTSEGSYDKAEAWLIFRVIVIAFKLICYIQTTQRFNKMATMRICARMISPLGGARMNINLKPESLISTVSGNQCEALIDDYISTKNLHTFQNGDIFTLHRYLQKCQILHDGNRHAKSSIHLF